MPRNNDFLNDFLGTNPPDPRKLSKNAVSHDRWDTEDFDRLLNEVKEFSASDDRLTDVVQTGHHAFADTYYSLVKADPHLLPSGQVRPTYQINRTVMDEVTQLKEYEELRTYTTGDDIGSALAVIQMEPKLEQLFDKAEQQQKLAEQLEQQMQQMVCMNEDKESLQDKINRLMEQIDAGEAPDGSEQQLVDYQQQQSLIQQAMEMLAADMEATANELGAEAQANAAAMKASIRQMLKDAVSEAKQNDTSALAWGLDPGVLHRLPADERLALAKRINSDRMRRIAELFGPMQRLAFAEQTRKTIHSREEVYDISQGNDISRLLPIEFMALEDEVLELDFFKRFVEGQLLQYELRGTEKLAKGGIVFCEDGSGSMTGDSELWAKAVGLCLLHIARAQKRSFYGIHFGGPKQIKCFDFQDTSSITPDRVIEFAECHFGGGTDFMTPLSKARDLLAEEFDRNGEVRGDIVFATDGMCGVDDKWFEAFKEEQERLGFRVYGIAIGCPTSSQPLAKICDHRVSTIKNLLTGGDVRDVFRAV